MTYKIGVIEDQNMEADQTNNWVKHGKRKLLFQIGVILVPLVLIMLVLVTSTVYRSTIEGFLKSQNDLMEERLDVTYENVFFTNEGINIQPLNAWALDYLEANTEVCSKPITDEEQAAFEAHLNDEDWWSLEWLERMPEEVRSYCAKVTLDNLQGSMAYVDEFYSANISELIMMDVNEPYEGFVICVCRQNPDGHSFGDTIKYSLSDLPALRSLLEDPSDRIEFERVDNFPMKGRYYIAYKPVFYQNKIRAVMMLPYSWTGLQRAMSGTLFKAFMVGVGGLVILLFILLYLLYMKAIAPVKQIQKGIQTYIRTKDASTVTDALGGIKERNEIGTLSHDLSVMVQEIDHYTAENVHMAEEREKTRTELTLARGIQEAILPKDWPVSDLFDLAASMTPAKAVGGDFYDFFFLDEDHLALVIADVSDKGIPAALFMMMCKNIIKNYARENLSPSEVLDRTNRNFLEYEGNTMFVTVWLGIYETTTGRVTAVNAGHEYPVIRKADSGFELFRDHHSLVVGAINNIRFKEYEFYLEEGGALFLYTDGVTEAANTKNELFGTGRMTEALNRTDDSSPVGLIRSMKAAIDEFTGEAPQSDDITMLVIRRTNKI